MFRPIILAIHLLTIGAAPIMEPYSWDELHTVASTNPNHFVKLVNDYYHNFPCDDCRNHFQQTVVEMEKFLPIHKIASVNEAKIWAWLVHNNVNLRLGNEWFPIDCLHLTSRRNHRSEK